MSCLLVRCRSCTPASTVELTDWLEGKVTQLSTDTPRAAVRLTRLVQDLPTATLDDGWLIEISLEGERGEDSDSLAASLEEILRDMRIIGLDPTLLVPKRLPTAGGDPAQEPLRREDLRPEDLRPPPLESSSPANSSECSSRVSRVRRMCSWLISEALQGSRSCNASRISRCSE